MRHAVIHQRAGQRLAGIRIEIDLLADRLADALHDRAMGLAVHDQGIDAAADVVDRGVAGDRHRAGIGIDLHFANGGAVGKHRLVHLVVGDDRNAVLVRLRQFVLGRLLGEFEEIEGAVGVARAKPAVVERDIVRRRASTTAAIALPLAMRSTAALENTVAAWRIERPEWVPPPA